VQKTSTDPTPVPDAEITIFVGGGSGLPQICQDDNLDFSVFPPALCAVPAGDGFVWQTTTDDQGVVRVFPIMTTNDCGTSTVDIGGNLNISAVISANQDSWIALFSIDCSP
jgi:hypothetical protein